MLTGVSNVLTNLFDPFSK